MVNLSQLFLLETKVDVDGLARLGDGRLIDQHTMGLPNLLKFEHAYS